MKTIKLFVISAIFAAVALVSAPEASAQSYCQDFCGNVRVDVNGGSDMTSIVVQNGMVKVGIVVQNGGVAGSIFIRNDKTPGGILIVDQNGG